MTRELFAGITVEDFVYLAAILGAGIVVALVVKVVTTIIKRRLRRRTRTNLVAQIVDDLDGPLFLWVLTVSLYLGLLLLPPADAYAGILRQWVVVATIALVVVTAIHIQGHALNWYLRRVGRRTSQVKVFNSLLPMVKRIATLVILAMGILIIMDQLGISIAPLIAGLGIGGLAVALALQGTLTNFFAGLNILTDGSIRIGDFVELESGMSGYVDQIGWRTTRIRMLANNMVIIPNTKLADSIATNYNYPEDQMSVYLAVGVSYASDLDYVERVTVEVAKQVMDETVGAVEGYEPSVWYTEFGDSNINFWVVLRAHGYGESWLLKHNFVKALFRRYNEEGIEISFPARNIYMRGGTTEPGVTETNAAQIEEAARSRSRGTGDGESRGGPRRRISGVDLGAAEQGASGDPTGGAASPGGDVPPG